MTLLSLSKKNWTVLIGNAYDHYDSALYGLMVPFLAPLFFPSFDPVVQLIMGYGFLCTSIVERPISVFIFSFLAEKNGEQWALSFSLLGAGLFTLCIGFLPIYGQIGVWAPFGLFFIKFIRGFFLSGERVVARFFLLRNQKKDQAFILSSYYESSTVLGILIASFSVFLISHFDTFPHLWRLPFIMGGGTALLGGYLRGMKQDFAPQTMRLIVPKKHMFKAIIKQFFVFNFSQITYVIPFVFFNALIPLITPVSLEVMLGSNVVFLLLDFILLPILGHFFSKKCPYLVMKITLLLFCVTLVPLFFFLENAPFWYVACARFWIVFLGLIFLSPLSSCTVLRTKGNKRYMIVGMASALSSAFIGKTLPFIGLSLWKFSGTTIVPAVYILAICLPAFWGLRSLR